MSYKPGDLHYAETTISPCCLDCAEDRYPGHAHDLDGTYGLVDGVSDSPRVMGEAVFLEKGPDSIVIGGEKEIRDLIRDLQTALIWIRGDAF